MDVIISHIVLMEQQRATTEVNGLINVNEKTNYDGNAMKSVG